MHQLHDADENVVRRAESQLDRRGFDTAQLELARQLTDADPREREQLAELLPRVPGIDAKTWLLWLSRDEDADVRLAALTVMATTGDPQVLKRIELISRNDADPRIQRQGERLSKLRRGEK
jgi:HEAT repeat protein